MIPTAMNPASESHGRPQEQPQTAQPPVAEPSGQHSAAAGRPPGEPYIPLPQQPPPPRSRTMRRLMQALAVVLALAASVFIFRNLHRDAARTGAPAAQAPAVAK